ncbi:MAG: phosphoribosylaminoimidazolecarboxamide formyltransferase / cyclohydrolase [Chloroflexota bacterium]|jgi:phosphoribosylaminoimidazolecarboxamide formyltransferase/IMP cyclohydrolase|nr:phosphoribosylaminoimidazolecarboxamide formyltransferase / cyclohydrolase [Chloroflexota bacterium]
MRALLSVYDKTGIVDFARALLESGVELISTGGTEELLRNSGLAVRPIQDVTGLPEMLGGRVKTLHPAVHAGILARRSEASDLAELDQHGFAPIDLVVCNLYPFVQTVQEPNVTREDAVENIDIGGVTLLRAAAKNYHDVVVVCDPDDYQDVIDGLRQPAGVSQDTRERLAARAFDHCAVYDSCIASYLRPRDDLFPKEFAIALNKVTGLRYGENPHQLAAFYRDLSTRGMPLGVAAAEQLHGIPISFNNTLDLDVAWEAVTDFQAPTIVITQHGNPCGLACDQDLAEAFRRALESDPQSAFGGAIAVNREVDRALAQEIAPVFFEDIIAPSYTDEALDVLRKKDDLRVMRSQAFPSNYRPAPGQPVDLDYKRVSGGFLVQTRDTIPEGAISRDVVTARHPTLEEVTSLLFAWRAVKHVRSHGVLLARKLSLVGVGAGQASRLDSVDLACRKAGERAAGSVLASDGFFPFPDGIERAAESGVTAIIQPGGSIRDQQAIDAANRARMAMIFTHQRHLRY